MMKTNLRLIKNLCRLTQIQLLDLVSKELKRYYYKVITTDKYVIAEGQSEVALIAHLDTVNPTPSRNIFYDADKQVMWSPQLLGADDRAGVYAILRVIEMGYRPHIIFTVDEELGCIGASQLVIDHPKLPFTHCKALIQLDRQGENDCVFYSCDNKHFTSYIEKYGFVEAQGSFSDISVLGPAWGVAAVNLSVGYYLEHTYCEFLRCNELENTILKVGDILDDVKKMPSFKYIPKKLKSEIITCDFCKKPTIKGKRVYVDNLICCKECYLKYY